MAIVHISKYEYTQKVWRAREKRCSRGKGLPLGGYNTGILMDRNTNLEDLDELVFFNSYDENNLENKSWSYEGKTNGNIFSFFFAVNISNSFPSATNICFSQFQVYATINPT